MDDVESCARGGESNTAQEGGMQQEDEMIDDQWMEMEEAEETPLHIRIEAEQGRVENEAERAANGAATSSAIRSCKQTGHA